MPKNYTEISQAIVNAVGGLGNIDAVTHCMHDRIIPIESTMKIKPTESPYAVIDWLKKVGGFFYQNENGNFTQIKVKYNDDLNKARTVTMYSNNIKLDALEKTFIKKSVIEGFSSRLKSSYDNINSEIINKLHSII